MMWIKWVILGMVLAMLAAGVIVLFLINHDEREERRRKVPHVHDRYPPQDFGKGE